MVFLHFSNVFPSSNRTSVHTLCVFVPVEDPASGDGDTRVSGALPALPGPNVSAGTAPLEGNRAVVLPRTRYFCAQVREMSICRAMHGQACCLVSAHSRAVIWLNLGADKLVQDMGRHTLV